MQAVNSIVVLKICLCGFDTGKSQILPRFSSYSSLW